MKLSILYVNYKTPQLLLNSLESLYAFDRQDVEVIVVDNDSKDQTEALLAAQFPQVRFIQMGYNAGFARANNAGLRLANGEVMLLINTDTLVLDNAVNRCLAHFNGDSEIACGVQLLNEDHTPQISGNYAMKGGLNHLLPLPYLGNWLKGIAEMVSVKKTNLPEARGKEAVDWINGAFLMIKKEVLHKAGYLDEDFFLYAEEAEWCSRIKKHGKLCIYGDCKIMHLQGLSANEAFGSEGKGYVNVFDRKGLQIMLSNLLRVRKEFGVGWFVLQFALHLFSVPVSLFAMLISTLNPFVKSKLNFQQWQGFAKNIVVLCGFFPRIFLNRPFFYKVL